MVNPMSGLKILEVLTILVNYDQRDLRQGDPLTYQTTGTLVRVEIQYESLPGLPAPVHLL
jgi:hypothetical protein